jgi:hypothetical protein
MRSHWRAAGGRINEEETYPSFALARTTRKHLAAVFSRSKKAGTGLVSSLSQQTNSFSVIVHLSSLELGVLCVRLFKIKTPFAGNKTPQSRPPQPRDKAACTTVATLPLRAGRRSALHGFRFRGGYGIFLSLQPSKCYTIGLV